MISERRLSHVSHKASREVAVAENIVWFVIVYVVI